MTSILVDEFLDKNTKAGYHETIFSTNRIAIRAIDNQNPILKITWVDNYIVKY